MKYLTVRKVSSFKFVTVNHYKTSLELPLHYCESLEEVLYRNSESLITCLRVRMHRYQKVGTT